MKFILAFVSVAMIRACIAAELSAADLRDAPESVEVEGTVLTAVAYPYFNQMPRLGPAGDEIDCRRDGSFIVTVDISFDGGTQVLPLEADRIWVVQGETVWMGPARFAGAAGIEGVMRFRSQDEMTEIDMRLDRRTEVQPLDSGLIWVARGNELLTMPAIFEGASGPGTVIRFRSQDCDSPIRAEPPIRMLENGHTIIEESPPKAQTVVRFRYAQKPYLLRAPDVSVDTAH